MEHLYNKIDVDFAKYMGQLAVRIINLFYLILCNFENTTLVTIISPTRFGRNFNELRGLILGHLVLETGSLWTLKLGILPSGPRVYRQKSLYVMIINTLSFTINIYNISQPF